MSQIYFNSPVNDQIDSFQTTLASLNQKVISLQEALQEREAEITNLKENTTTDQTLTIVGILIKLYQYIFLPGKLP